MQSLILMMFGCAPMLAFMPDWTTRGFGVVVLLILIGGQYMTKCKYMPVFDKAYIVTMIPSTVLFGWAFFKSAPAELHLVFMSFTVTLMLLAVIFFTTLTVFKEVRSSVTVESVKINTLHMKMPISAQLLWTATGLCVFGAVLFIQAHINTLQLFGLIAVPALTAIFVDLMINKFAKNRIKEINEKEKIEITTSTWSAEEVIANMRQDEVK